jgi:hypothetical protein
MIREQKRVLSMPKSNGVSASSAGEEQLPLQQLPISGGQLLAPDFRVNPRFAPPVLEEPVETEEAARFVHMSPQHLKQLAREGKVPAHPRGDGQRRRWLFFLSELAVWIRSQVNSACDPCRA